MPRFDNIQVGGDRPSSEAAVAKIVASHGEDSTTDPTNGSDYWLLLESDGPGTEKGRLYFCPGSTALADANGDLIWTWNARWNESAGNWVKDNGAGDASMFALPGANGAAQPEFAFRVVDSASPFGDGDWTTASGTFRVGVNPTTTPESVSLQMTNSNSNGFSLSMGATEVPVLQMAGSNLATGTAPTANAIYMNSIPKAWLWVRLGATGPTEIDSFGISTFAYNLGSPDSLDITINNAMAAAEYIVLGVQESLAGVGHFPTYAITDTDEVTVSLRDGATGTIVDMDNALLNNVALGLVWFGTD